MCHGFHKILWMIFAYMMLIAIVAGILAEIEKGFEWIEHEFISIF